MILTGNAVLIFSPGSTAKPSEYSFVFWGCFFTLANAMITSRPVLICSYNRININLMRRPPTARRGEVSQLTFRALALSQSLIIT